MSAARPSTTEILDAAADVVGRLAAPWVGVLWLTALPLRFLQAHFVARVAELGRDAPHYGDYLGWLANLTSVALVVALFGRILFVRAVRVGLTAHTPRFRDVVRGPFAGAASAICVALLFEVLFLATAVSVVAMPIFVLLAGLAVATHSAVERPGLLPVLKEVSRALSYGRTLAALLGVFAVAFIIAAVNLAFVFRIGVWLSGALPGFDPTPWDALLSLQNRRFLAMLALGAALAVEPFWLASLSVYVQRARAHTSGEDLRLWWARLSTTASLTTALVVTTSVAFAQDERLSLAQYRAALSALAGELEVGELDAARLRAQQLLGARVAFADEALATDASLLAPITRLSGREPAQLTARRLRALAAALEATLPPQGRVAPDHARLELLRTVESGSSPRQGGEVDLGPIAGLSFSDRLLAGIRAAMDRLARFFEWIWKLLDRMWPQRSLDRERQWDPGILTVTLIAVSSAVFVLLAWRALGARGRGQELLSGEGPTASARDEDPLSREAEEWQRYARELERAGRRREAIRAWYHAVLVTLFRSGRLHYQKGRTNWEYAALLSAQTSWRPSFLAITRRFDREWYGRALSSAEALAAHAEEAQQVLRALGGEARP